MKLGQLKSYNMRNVFLEKSYTKCDRETYPRPCSKKTNEAYLWTNSLKFYTLFIQFYTLIVYQVEGYRNILKLNCRLLVFTSCKTFFKEQRRSRTKAKHFSFYMLSTDQISLSGCFYFVRN